MTLSAEEANRHLRAALMAAIDVVDPLDLVDASPQTQRENTARLAIRREAWAAFREKLGGQ